MWLTCLQPLPLQILLSGIFYISIGKIYVWCSRYSAGNKNKESMYDRYNARMTWLQAPRPKACKYFSSGTGAPLTICSLMSPSSNMTSGRVFPLTLATLRTTASASFTLPLDSNHIIDSCRKLTQARQSSNDIQNWHIKVWLLLHSGRPRHIGFNVQSFRTKQSTTLQTQWRASNFWTFGSSGGQLPF